MTPAEIAASVPLPWQTGICIRSSCFYHHDVVIAHATAVAAAAVAAEREACAALCDVTPPYPFRPSIEAAHAIRARSSEQEKPSAP
jgi:hypothetical protein